MTIPLFKVFMADDAPARVTETLMSGYIGEGERVQEFEQAFGQLVGASSTPLALNSCTSALDLALHLCGVGLGSEVITTPMTCTATNGVIVNRGAKIVWADVDPVTGLIDPRDVRKKITKRTKAVMAVDWAGRSCNYAGLKLAVHIDTPWLTIPIIQDAAHNLMVDMHNRGDYVAWSFQAIKHLTTGDGGALLLPAEQRERGRLLRWYGLDRTSSADFRCSQAIKEAGFKYHMNDIAASIGLANIKHAQWVVDRHRENAAWYLENLQGSVVSLPPPDPTGSWWLFCVQVEDQAGFIAHLTSQGIGASPVHARNDKHPAFYFPNGPLPGVDTFSSREVAIPSGWWVGPKEREEVARAVRAWGKVRPHPKKQLVAA